jgi:hypothetical protein
MIGALISLAREKGRGAMIWFVMEACNGGLHRLLEQRLLRCKPASHHQFQLLVYSTCSLLIIIITQIMHGMQGQNSWLHMASFWCSLCHVYTEK